MSSTLDKILEIEQQCFPEEPLSRRQIKYYLDNTKSLVYTLGEDAYIILSITKNKTRIYSVAVIPSEQSKGRGKFLIEKVIEETKLLGKSKITLECKNNLVSFYEKLGFKVTKELKNYYKNGDDAYKMELKLK